MLTATFKMNGKEMTFEAKNGDAPSLVNTEVAAWRESVLEATKLWLGEHAAAPAGKPRARK